MGTHEARIDKLETDVNDPDNGLKVTVKANSVNFIKANAKMTAILWLFGIIIALGIANLVIGNI